jgi:tetratricopeptide (TPR) repeat protein
MTAGTTKQCIVCGRQFPIETERCPDDDVILSEGDPLVGQNIDGKYQILSFVGVGGASRVYKAIHLDLGRTIALKFLKSSTPLDLQRFRREAVSVSQLNHPNIARVFSFSVTSRGEPYLAMEFLEGRSLAALTANEVLTLTQTVTIIAQIAEGLSLAHRQGIVHRDVKPGNIMIVEGPTGRTAKIVDFGMARLLLRDGKQKLTQTGEIFGTLQYISPEQYKGVSADHRADIFSLGVMLFELVTIDGKVPDKLKDFIARAIEPEPEDRYQSMEAFQEDLEQSTKSLDQNIKYTPMQLDVEFSDRRQPFWNIYLVAACAGLLCVSVAATMLIQKAFHKAPEQNYSRLVQRSLPVGIAALKLRVHELINALSLNEADELCRKWLKQAQNDRTLTRQILSDVTLELARIQSFKKNWVTAKALWMSELQYLEKTPAENYGDQLVVRLELVRVLGGMGDFASARDLIEQTRALVVKVEGKDSNSDLFMQYQSAALFELEHNDRLAEPAYRALVQHCTDLGDNARNELSVAQLALGRLYLRASNYKEAARCFRAVMRAGENAQSHLSLLAAEAGFEQGILNLRIGQLEKATKLMENGWNVLKNHPYTFNPGLLHPMRNLAQKLRDSGKIGRSVEWFKRAETLQARLQAQGIGE